MNANAATENLAVEAAVRAAQTMYPAAAVKVRRGRVLAVEGDGLAVRTFDPRRGRSFKSWAEFCIRQEKVGVVRRRRVTVNPLDGAAGLDATTEDATADTALRNLIIRADLKKLKGKLGALEGQVLVRRLVGFTTQEIACDLGCQPKAVKDALARVRRKAARLGIRLAPAAADEADPTVERRAA